MDAQGLVRRQIISACASLRVKPILVSLCAWAAAFVGMATLRLQSFPLPYALHTAALLIKCGPRMLQIVLNIGHHMGGVSCKLCA